jgi:hypothetical protein
MNCTTTECLNCSRYGEVGQNKAGILCLSSHFEGANAIWFERKIDQVQELHIDVASAA